MSTTPAIPTQASAPAPPRPFLADLYTFDFSAFNLRLPLISASAVALCLFTGVGVGHPGGALLAGGGALTIAFGANQRIADSRLIPMLFAVFAVGTATLAGTLAGHNGPALILCSAVAAAIYGVLTIRDAGLAWVGQQAAVSLFVASAFPSGPRQSFTRSGLIVTGGIVQIIITSIGLRMLPELRKDLHTIQQGIYAERHLLLDRIRTLPMTLSATLPATLDELERTAAIAYTIRLVLTVSVASELYRRLGLQSGYWVPMTALLVQKPAFTDTLARGLARIAGTLAGATLATILAAHMHLGAQSDWVFAALTTFFALLSFATNSVNYGLFSLCLTSYIVFLLSLNQIPGPEIAHRRAWCTVAGAVIAFLVHLDQLLPQRRGPTR